MFQRIMLILFISSELSYYLLIAQTGIVESYGSNIYAIALLPIGGVIGSFLSIYLKLTNNKKILIFLLLQLFASSYYPSLSHIMLFILGISVGALAPLVINSLKKATYTDIGIILAISYTVGVSLFNYDPFQRLWLALILTSLALIGSQFVSKMDLNKNIKQYRSSALFSLFTMVLWIFLDSALFETLSRDEAISIWRGGYSIQIIIFHIIGIIMAFNIKIDKNHKELFIIMLFALSYLAYFLQEGYILSIIYPFVISYYNVVILQTLVQEEFKAIAFSMVFIGWIGSGAGLFIALHGLIVFIPILFLIGFFKIIATQNTHIKEVKYV